VPRNLKKESCISTTDHFFTHKKSPTTLAGLFIDQNYFYPKALKPVTSMPVINKWISCVPS
jgi:hypothetical protein